MPTETMAPRTAYTTAWNTLSRPSICHGNFHVGGVVSEDICQMRPQYAAVAESDVLLEMENRILAPTPFSPVQ